MSSTSWCTIGMTLHTNT